MALGVIKDETIRAVAARALWQLEGLIETLRQMRTTALRVRSHEHAVSCEELIARMESERTQLAQALYGPADEAM